MQSDETPSRYPYLISVRGGRPVPARKDGHYYVCAYQVFLGLWWAPREVRVLEYDPHRDFYREQRQAKEAADRDHVRVFFAPVDSPAPSATTTAANAADAAVWERVDGPGPRRPTPPAGTTSYAPQRAWGR